MEIINYFKFFFITITELIQTNNIINKFIYKFEFKFYEACVSVWYTLKLNLNVYMCKKTMCSSSYILYTYMFKYKLFFWVAKYGWVVKIFQYPEAWRGEYRGGLQNYIVDCEKKVCFIKELTEKYEIFEKNVDGLENEMQIAKW